METMTLAGRSWDGIQVGPSGLPARDLAGELIDRLAREFDAPVGLLDPRGRVWVARLGVQAADFPDPDAASGRVRSPGVAGRVSVWRPGSAAGPIWLVLPVGDAGAADDLVALVGFAAGPGPAEAGPWGPPCPEPALRAWGREVADRLYAEASSRQAAAPRPATPAPLSDRLVRRLRVSDPPERFQRLAAHTLREALGAAAVAWVPSTPREPVVVDEPGGSPGPEAYRVLVPESPEGPARRPDEAAPLDPDRATVVACSNEEAGAGWFVVLRAAGEPPLDGAAIEMLRSAAAIVAAQRANARLYSDLKDLLFGVIRALTSAIDAKDPYTSGHSERVARIAVRLGEQLGLNAAQRGDLYLMGLLHDVGKIGIEDGVLKKPSRLTPEEYRHIQAHVQIGVHILSDLKKLHHLLPGVAHHHENLDGSGYPAGLAGEAIPLAARILAVADAYDAMSSSRPYRRRLSPEAIDEILRNGAGTQWDPQVVDALFACRADIERIRSKGLGESLRRVVGATLGRPEAI